MPNKRIWLFRVYVWFVTLVCMTGCANSHLPQATTPTTNPPTRTTIVTMTPVITYSPLPTISSSSTSPNTTPVLATVAPTPTSKPQPVQLSEQDVLSILGIKKTDLIALRYYDLNSDGINDVIALFRNEPPSAYSVRLVVSAVDSASRKHRDISLPFDMGLQSQTIQLAVLPVTNKADKTQLFIITGGQYGGTVSHVGYSVLQYTGKGWQDIFSQFRDVGMQYTLAMENGPRAILTLENGQKFTLMPTDIETYRTLGWIDGNGNLTPQAQVFDEHIGFSTLSYAVEKGVLTLRGSQEIRGLHKLDVLAILNTVWKYNGSNWSVTAEIIPVSSDLVA